MKLLIALSALMAGFVAASTEEARAVVYCQYVNYPVGCAVRPGVVLRPRPVARCRGDPGRRSTRCRSTGGNTDEPRRSGQPRGQALRCSVLTCLATTGPPRSSANSSQID